LGRQWSPMTRLPALLRSRSPQLRRNCPVWPTPEPSRRSSWLGDRVVIARRIRATRGRPVARTPLLIGKRKPPNRPSKSESYVTIGWGTTVGSTLEGLQESGHGQQSLLKRLGQDQIPERRKSQKRRRRPSLRQLPHLSEFLRRALYSLTA